MSITKKNKYLEDNLKILTKHAEDISCIFLKNFGKKLSLDIISSQFPFKEVERNTDELQMGSSLMADVLDHIESDTVLFLDNVTLLNRNHFGFFLNASKTLTQGFIAGITLAKEGEHWKPQDHVSSSELNSWENFLSFALNTSLFGGVIFHINFLEKYQKYCSDNNIFSDMTLLLDMYRERTSPSFFKVLSLRDRPNSLRIFDPCKTKEILNDLTDFVDTLKNQEIIIQFYNYIMPILWDTTTRETEWGARLESFLSIRSFVEKNYPRSIKTINFCGQKLSVDNFLSVDAISLLKLAKIL